MDYSRNIQSTAFKCLLLLLFCFISLSCFSQSALQSKKIIETYKSSKITTLTSKLEREYTINRKNTLRLAKQNGWKISEKLPNGDYIELQEIGIDGTPIYYTTLNDNVSNVTRANTLYNTGVSNLQISGEGMRIGVWDAGVALTNHQEFGTRAEIGDYTNTINSHATMVMGTLIASGIKEKARGVAYKAHAVTNNWVMDRAESAAAAANGLLISNHSYGIKTDRVPDWYFGAYLKVSQDWDKIMYNAPYYLMVTAAGNAQKSGDNDAPIYGNSGDGYDLILGFATTKNGITVAAADTKIDSQGELLSATASSYSSYGPVDDGRIKPDIAGEGLEIYSTNSSNTSSYRTAIGTSMATPGVSGSMLLLQQYYEQLNASYMKAATLKGLVLHSADDVNAPGPDYKMGWGVMNSKAAAEIIVNEGYSSSISEETLNSEENTYTITVNASGDEPLMASISWTDPASENLIRASVNNSTRALVNDLDIRITKNGETFYPWKLSALNAENAATKGDNRVDPFEKITIDAAEGTYTITVTYKGTLQNQLQNFSLIVSGTAITACRTAVPSEIFIDKAEDTSVTMEWGAIEDALFEVQYREENTTTWTTFYTEETSILLDKLQKEKKYEIRLRTFCTENVASKYTRGIEFIFYGKSTDLVQLLESKEFNESSEIEFSIYPNPTVDNITLEGNLSEKAKYSIVTTTGLIVKQGDATEAEINVSNLATGLYILSVQDNNGRKSSKFFKG